MDEQFPGWLRTDQGPNFQFQTFSAATPEEILKLKIALVHAPERQLQCTQHIQISTRGANLQFQSFFWRRKWCGFRQELTNLQILHPMTIATEICKQTLKYLKITSKV